MKHVERLAAGMADINDCVFRYEPPVVTRRWPIGKLALNFIGLASVFGVLWML